MSVKLGLASITDMFETEKEESNTVIQELKKQLDQTNALLSETRNELKIGMSACISDETNLEVTR